MAEPFSPTLEEPRVRTFPVGGYSDRSANYLADRLGSIGRTLTESFAAVQEENKLRPWAEQLDSIRAESEQTDDNGRPIVSNQRVRSKISALISNAYIEGGEEIGRHLATAADNVFGGSLGSFTNDMQRKREEDFIGAAIDRGMTVLPEGTPEEQYRAGLEHMQLEQEMDAVSERLQLARDQLSFNTAQREAAETEALRGTWGVIQKGMNQTLQPFLQSIANADFSDPTELTNARKMLVAKEEEFRAWVAQVAAEGGLLPGAQAELMQQTTERFRSVSDGLDMLGKLPKEQLDNMITMFGLNEVQMGTSLGRMKLALGEQGASNFIVNSAEVMDPQLRHSVGSRLNEFILSDAADGFATRLGALDYSKADSDVPVVRQLLNADLDPASMKTFANSLRYFTRGAMGADRESQINALEEVTTPKFLENLESAQYSLNPQDMTNAVTDYYVFTATMVDRSMVQLDTILQTHEGIDINTDDNGNVSVSWDGVMESLAQTGSAYLQPGLGFLARDLNMVMEGGRQVDEYQAFQEAERLASTVNRANTALNKVETDMGYFLRNTRGLRNKNPGNIEKTNIPWRGKDPQGEDPRFETFRTVDEGIRAIGRSVKTNAGRGMSVDQFINRWAPSNENNTSAYIGRVEQEVGVSAQTKMSQLDADQVARLVAGIIQVENGYNPFNLDFIKSAINLD